MNLTLDISPELEEALRRTAERAGLPPDRYALDAIEERLTRDRDLPPHLPHAEAELLRRINEGLPEASWARYHALKQQRDAETLTPEEHAELIRLVNEVEGWNVRRLEAVAALAKLRGVHFADLVQELGLYPPPDA